MDKSTLYQRMQFQKEFDSLVWQIMTRVKRGETIPDSDSYRRVKHMLEQRAYALCNGDTAQIRSESDWLALALYAEDREWFATLCVEARDYGDEIYLKAENWLGGVISATIAQYYTHH
ncbi:MAG: hypothetical protein AAF787_17165 [Chloroflexota bacterium]